MNVKNGENESDKDLEKIRRKKLEGLKNKLENPVKSEPLKSDTGGKIIILDVSNFWNKVRENEKILVDCYTDWCFPCKTLEPIFAELAKTHKDILFGRLNIDNAPAIAAKFQIQAIPLILFFKQGQIVNRLVGAHPYNTIESYIQKYMS